MPTEAEKVKAVVDRLVETGKLKGETLERVQKAVEEKQERDRASKAKP